ncbi:hypothetical protein WT01_25670 [Burkholderia cepacia]|nr:hypothetical protein WT01_25670 [Burkholderia cepacia]
MIDRRARRAVQVFCGSPESSAVATPLHLVGLDRFDRVPDRPILTERVASRASADRSTFRLTGGRFPRP